MGIYDIHFCTHIAAIFVFLFSHAGLITTELLCTAVTCLLL